MDPPSPQAPPPPPPSAEAYTSILAQARLHCGERILVRPILWTDRQLELLQCTFGDAIEAAAAHTAAAEQQPLRYECERGVVAYISRWKKWRHGYSGVEAIEGVLASRRSPLVSSSEITRHRMSILAFHFDGRRVDRLPCIKLYLRDDPNLQRAAPLAVYVDGGFILAKRQKVLGIGQQQFLSQLHNSNFPGWILSMLKMKKVTPKDPWRDPCIVAFLIALARAMRVSAEAETERAEGEGKSATGDCPTPIKHPRPGSSASTVTPHVFFTSDLDTKHIHLYTAKISYSFIDKFEHPAIPSAPEPLEIQHTVIPLAPYESLRDRLLTLILPDPDGSRTNSKR